MTSLTVVRPDAALPGPTTETLFSVVGGLVEVTGLVGLVTEAVDGSQNSEIKFDDVSVWAGNLAGFEDTYLIGSPSGDGSGGPIAPGRIARAGVAITLITASTSGSVTWVLTYRPITPGAYVAAS